MKKKEGKIKNTKKTIYRDWNAILKNTVQFFNIPVKGQSNCLLKYRAFICSGKCRVCVDRSVVGQIFHLEMSWEFILRLYSLA